VRWTKVRTNPDQTVGPVYHPNVRWDFNQDSFGMFVGDASLIMGTGRQMANMIGRLDIASPCNLLSRHILCS
jgi:hypothetical protein